jgi:hypothetical protein
MTIPLIPISDMPRLVDGVEFRCFTQQGHRRWLSQNAIPEFEVRQRTKELTFMVIEDHRINLDAQYQSLDEALRAAASRTKSFKKFEPRISLTQNGVDNFVNQVLLVRTELRAALELGTVDTNVASLIWKALDKLDAAMRPAIEGANGSHRL